MLKERKRVQSNEPVRPKPLRLWPGVIAAIFLLLVKFVVPMMIPDALPITMFGGLIFSLIIIVWWVFFSRAPHLERWGAILLMVIALVAIQPFLHDTIAKAGMGMLFFLLAIPILCLAFVGWAVLTRHLSNSLRRVLMGAIIFLGVGSWALIRTGGLNSEGDSDFAWRWAKTPEEQLLTRQDDEQTVPPSAVPTGETEAVWPGFRGPNRDGIIRGVRIVADWSASPPVELWRQPIGPGWSSFAVCGDLFYTQEQRGDDEVVSCYNVVTGKPIWKHHDRTRFWESNSGAGPRATPTLSGGRVYTFGATGILNVLNANDGAVVWSRNAADDTDTKLPYWGFSGSPLVVDDLVIVAAGGSLIAYDITTGNPRWSRIAGNNCYSSPHLLNISGVVQVLLQNEIGVISVHPADGMLLWEHSWPGHPIVQPALTAEGDILLSADDRTGVRCITVASGIDGWSSKERWTSLWVKPYFNDSVIHNGYIYGFDGSSLACIDVEDGTRKWKGGRYGRGQCVLLADQNLLMVISDKGVLALVNAVPDQFKELARFPAIKGKTWNHPVLVDDILLVRNSQEMAAFRLTLMNSSHTL